MHAQKYPGCEYDDVMKLNFSPLDLPKKKKSRALYCSHDKGTVMLSKEAFHRKQYIKKKLIKKNFTNIQQTH